MIVDLMDSIVKGVAKDVGFAVKFMYGNTLSVVNQITTIQKVKEVYPAIILFNEGLVITDRRYYTEVNVSKMAICTLTKYDMTDRQRLESTFAKTIYPCYDAFLRRLREVSLDYELIINRADIPYFYEGNNRNTFNQLVDGCVLRPFTLKVEKVACKKFKS